MHRWGRGDRDGGGAAQLTGPADYRFRPYSALDAPLVARWRAMPHVIEWWGDPSVEAEEEKADDPRIRMWIVEFQNKPFAYAQDYDVHGWPDHHFAHLPPRSRGIDQYIGEPDMLDTGHGTAFVTAHVNRLFALGTPAVGTDPHPDNFRAQAAYRKAGFSVAGPVIETQWGTALPLVRYNSSE